MNKTKFTDEYLDKLEEELSDENVKIEFIRESKAEKMFHKLNMRKRILPKEISKTQVYYIEKTGFGFINIRKNKPVESNFELTRKHKIAITQQMKELGWLE